MDRRKPPKASRGTRERRWPELLLALASILISLTAAEVGLRLFYYRGLREPPPDTGLRMPHPSRGWALKPLAVAVRRTPDFLTRVEINSKGLRDVEHDYVAPPDVFRIVVLGDSFMEAEQVDLDDSLPRRLDRRLERTEVVNLSVAGYGTLQEYLYLKEEGLRYSPDLVLLTFYPENDVRNNLQLLEEQVWQGLRSVGRPYASVTDAGELSITFPDYDRLLAREQRQQARQARRRAERGILERSLLYSRLEQLLRRPTTRTSGPNLWLGPMLERFDPAWGREGMAPEEYRAAWSEAWRITERLLIATRDLAVGNGADFAVMVIPSKLQVEREFRRRAARQFPGLQLDVDRPNARLVTFGRAHDIPVLDLLPAFQAEDRRAPGSLFHRHVDHHWNARGHEVATEALVEFLRHEGLLDRDAGSAAAGTRASSVGATRPASGK